MENGRLIKICALQKLERREDVKLAGGALKRVTID